MKTKRIVAVDSQKLDSIQNCMYQYKLRFMSGKDNAGLEPQQVPDYFEKGGLLHKMLETYYTLKQHKSRWRMNNKTHQDVVQSCVVAGRHAATKMQLDIAEIEQVIDAFEQYTDFWENDNWNQILAIEKVGSKVLYDSPELCILYEFKVDLILNINGTTTPIDHKSAKSRRDPNYMGNQFKGYCWALDVNTLLVNEIGFQKTLKPTEKFRRQTMTFSDNVIKEWVANSIWWIQHAIKLIDNEEFPMNFTSCDKYSGCLFKQPICTQDPEVRLYKIDQFFQSRSWDVGREHL